MEQRVITPKKLDYHMNRLVRPVTHDNTLQILAIENDNTMLLTPVKNFSGTKELNIYNKIPTWFWFYPFEVMLGWILSDNDFQKGTAVGDTNSI